jgi:uncharacterized repeat protein (TIGR03837 family)
MGWDIFCRVIDNHGDAGVCWRLAAELAARGEAVRLWIDEPAPLRWLAPPGHPGVQVVTWTDEAPALPPRQVVIEAFGCDPPPAFVARMAAAQPPPAWINLEYLSAQGYVERNHGLPSPVANGPGAGLVKHFFYPGFTQRTGGLLREADLQARRQAFDRSGWLQQAGIAKPADRQVSLFCYEPPALDRLLGQLATGPHTTDLLVTAGRAAAATRAAMAQLGTDWNAAGRLRLHWLPLLSQLDFDHLLWACHFNFVRGEDSLARALLAGVPFVWQLYEQDDAAHHDKLEAFLDWLAPPAPLRQAFRCWNGVAAAPLPPLDHAAWAEFAAAARQRALALPELAAGLQRFVGRRR